MMYKVIVSLESVSDRSVEALQSKMVISVKAREQYSVLWGYLFLYAAWDSSI